MTNRNDEYGSDFDDFGFSEGDGNDATDVGDEFGDDFDDEYSQSFGSGDDESGAADLDAGMFGASGDDDLASDAVMDGAPMGAAANSNMIYMVAAGIVAILVIYFYLGGTSSEPSAQQLADKQAPAIGTKVNDKKAESAKADTKKDDGSMHDLMADKGADNLGDAVKQHVDETMLDGEHLANSAKKAQISDKNVQELEDKLKEVNERLASMESSFKKFDTVARDLAGVKSSLKSDGQRVRANQQKVNEVANAIDNLNNNIESMNRNIFNQQLNNSDNRVQMTSKQEADFVVLASIPTRAWLRNKNGALITIREGQSIPGYGKVKKIDPIRGAVTMSNREVFYEESQLVNVPK